MGLKFKSEGNDRYIINGTGRKGENCLINAMKDMNLFNNKHVPDIYKYTSREHRMLILAGMIDTDGSLSSSNYYEIAQKSNKVTEDFMYICRSLGFYVSNSPGKRTCTNSKNGPVTGIYNRMFISGRDIKDIPVKLPRKQSQDRTGPKDSMVSGFSISSIGIGRSRKITIDGDHYYISGTFVVMHD